MPSQPLRSNTKPVLILDPDTAVLLSAKERLNKLINASVPLFQGGGPNYTPEVIGTGFAIQIEARRMLITAGHVTDCLAERQFFIPNKGELRPFDCLISRFGRSDVARGQDEIDLSIIDLDEAQADQLRDHRFIRLNGMEVSTFASQPDVHYAFMGYPASRNKARFKVNEISTELIPYTGIPIAPAEQDKLARPLHTHLVINYDAKNARGLNGERWNPPSPKGISGCPVWVLGTPLDIVAGSKQALLAGMGIENKQRALIAVRMRIILQIIRLHHPDLGTVIPEDPTVNLRPTSTQRKSLILNR